MSIELSLEKVVTALPWYENAIAAIAPSWANRRLESRVQRHLFRYQAAQSDRIYSPRTWGLPSENMQTARDRNTMGWEARDLVENFTFAKSAIRKYSTFLTPTEYAPATGDRDYDKLVADRFHDWCKRCDVRQIHCFSELIQLATEMRPTWGDCGMAIKRVKDELRLDLIDGCRIGNPRDASGADSQFPQYISGIVVSMSGAPQAYRIFNVDPSGQYTDPKDIKATDFCHYFDPFRVDQLRGITDFHAALWPAKMLKSILEAELVGVRYTSQQVALIFNERGAPNPRNLFTSTPGLAGPSGQVPKNEVSDIGTLQYLSHGDKVETMPARPGSSFGGFVDEIKSQIAQGLGSYPAGVLWGTADYKGPSVRAEFAQADRANARHQRILDHKILSRVSSAWILNEIAFGNLPPPKRKRGESVEDTLQRATCGTFRFPPRLSIDVGRESQARLSELSMGATSPQEIAAEDGKDAYVRADEKADFAAYVKDLAADRGIPESSIFLPAGQQLPNTPAMAGVVGPNAGGAAATAQAESIPTPEPAAPEPAPEDPGTGTPIGDQTPIAELMAGPRAARRTAFDKSAKGMHRRTTLLRKTGDTSRDADEIAKLFSKFS